MREEIVDFAKAMEAVMQKHDGIKGNSWKTCSIEYLEKCLIQEYDEWKSQKETVIGKIEVIDIANICMMLFYRYSKCEN